MARLKDDFEELAGLFLMMSIEVRLAILQLLAKREMSVIAIQEKLQFPQSTTSHHLNTLHRSGLVERRRGLKRMYFYRLADLSKHHLGEESKFAAPGTNAARFGPVELVIQSL